MLGLIARALIVVVFTIFMLIRREDLRNRLISLIGHGHMHLVTQTLDEASSRVSRYLLMQFLVNMGYGIFIGMGLYFIGLPGALLWGVIVGILRFLPYVGPPLGGIMPLILSMAVFSGWSKPLMVLGLFVITELAVSNLLEPMLYGAHTGISSLAIVVAAIFWTAIWGPDRTRGVNSIDRLSAGGWATCSAAAVSAHSAGRRAALDARVAFLSAAACDGP